eukprot:COSAG01_NODE_47650_length_388_cov_1.058824_1_plen_55_part_10
MYVICCMCIICIMYAVPHVHGRGHDRHQSALDTAVVSFVTRVPSWAVLCEQLATS